MKYDTEYKLEEFRKEQVDLFNENGKRYTGVGISNRQCEVMLELINELESELNKYAEPNTYFIPDIFLPVTIIPINDTTNRCRDCRGYGKECQEEGSAWVYCTIFNHPKMQNCGLDISGEGNVGCNNFINKNTSV